MDNTVIENDVVNKPQTTSPVVPDPIVVPKTLMTFPEAMIEVVNGHSIKRKEWGELDEYGLLKDGWLEIHKAVSNRFDVWKVSDGDMQAEDWFVMKQGN